MYHRVADLAIDPWLLAVSPKHFAVQLAALKEEREVVPLPWLTAKLREGKSPRRAVAITFDDGYADVLLNAKPMLEKQECPATVFLATGLLGGDKGFWWDILARILLETPVLPDHLALDIAGRRQEWQVADLGKERITSQGLSRSDLHSSVWQELRQLDASSRELQIERLATWAGVDASARPDDRSLTSDEVRRLSLPGFIDIGAHTVNHPSLPMISDDDKRREILESRRACENLVGAPVNGFAYPFGDVDGASVRAVREAGLSFACTTLPGTAIAGGDPFRLPRVPTANWGSANFRRQVMQFG
jgi:peptidoglycan/xylan/chitin deacetylase (PgdA/CDA1 family)